ncbi:DUF1640 domain-containing protein [Pseudomonas gingeri]|uniref:DUF1640 domain-containing protein n=1 Tax=Pseudomonas gingeri TaxID=117681 RepID=UPI0015A2A8C1|nr:DUF1640 domain-containing protein [Pseudomonas gingeri]NWA02799.1 DUF1640 domain-containing protein [Pseudomonas gingeri]NWA18240.1 DUF1640 domain-containing protein [Pseudomonas gingeri]NWA58970.1 DUF1640 domain-containing protein [Pseudomonas gingeri]NWA99549.1 DUF1640 domain-containing protein [Pseudomonas gingeri]NWB05554.1 DUF1640 domain-containing protein [Pseudomonas gingeri]
MNPSAVFFDVLQSANVSRDDAKAVVEAWEAEVQTLASKSDLSETEARLNRSISELREELHSSIKEQGYEFRLAIEKQSALIEKQGSDFRLALEKQGNDLRLAMERQGNDLRISMEKQGSDLRESHLSLESRYKLANWQFGIIILCLAIPVGRELLNFLANTFKF